MQTWFSRVIRAFLWLMLLVGLMLFMLWAVGTWVPND